MKKNGYTIPELIVVIVLIGVVALFSITKVSYAFEEINDAEQSEIDQKALVEQATVAYAKSKKEEFKKEEESFIYAKEVASAGFLFEKDDYNTMKVKIAYNHDKNEFTAEVIK